MRRALLLVLGIACWVTAPAVPAARAQQPAAERGAMRNDLPVLFKADEMQHDRELGVVTARGNVEISQGDRVLFADMVSYNQGADLLTANGNIRLLEPTGDVVFADHMELTGDFKNGVIADIRLRMADNARFAAVGGRLSGGVVTEMRKAVYSPCLPCAANPQAAPTWQVKASTVTHNKTQKTVEYEDARMEIYGVPVAYIPYFSHPDPTVKRKSGLLAPRYGSETTLGVMAEVPYYFAIAPDRDATFAPVFTSKEGVVLAGEYRQRFTDGELKFQASGTRSSENDADDKDSNRGHLFGDIRFDLDDTWRTGADVRLSSDDTYLRRYRYFSGDTLTNRAFVEGFRGRNYAVGEGYYWRGLKGDDDPGLTPIVAPRMLYSFVSEPGRGGGRWSTDADVTVLTRTDGTDSRRLSLLTGWSLPHIARTGEVYNLYASVQTDAYWTNGVQEPDRPDGVLTNGATGRIFPRLGLDWRYPMARVDTRTTQVIEPIAGVVLAPNGGNPDLIPNEDSLDFEFDDTNLLSPNRFAGRDRVEGGQRVQYGLKAGLYGPGVAFASAFFGQSYRFREDDTFPAGSGLEDDFSDFVGRVQIRPNAPFDLLYRFRLDKDDLSMRRNEVSTTIGPRALNLNLGYLFVDQFGASSEFAHEFGARQELVGAIRSQLTPNWGVGLSMRRNLEDNQSLAHGANVIYTDDCLVAQFDYIRTFTQDRDIKPSDTFLLRLIFKNLGEVQSSL